MSHTTLPVYLDPFFIGLIFSIIGIAIGNNTKKATQEDKDRFTQLHIRPEVEKNLEEDRKTRNLQYLYLVFGIIIGITFVMIYAIPYMKAVG